MKKILLGAAIVLALASCQNGDKSASTAGTGAAAADSTTADSSKANTLPKLLTLNGADLKEADGMVTDFITKPGQYDTPTSIWFSSDYVKNVYDILIKENADGFRLYFAKTAEGKNTIVIVSTRNLHPDAPGDKIHTDYFEHKYPYLETAEKGVISNTYKDGALLYSPNLQCPDDDKCDTEYAHYLSCAVSATWANAYKTPEDIKTTSEWFDIGVLAYINKELQNTVNKPDGVRFYYAKIATKGHGFLFVTTHANNNVHEDYYTCLADKLIHPGDNGEQCPNNCNGVTWPAK